MKIFEISSDDGQLDYVAANTIVQCLKIYCSMTMIELNDLDDDVEIKELPEEKWAEKNVINPDYDPEDLDDWKTMTFKQWMSEATSPDIIAGTCYDV